MASVLLFASCVLSYAQTPTEQEVKAAFIYNFVNFVEWPESSFGTASEPFVIGVAGNSNYSALLTELVKGESYHGHQIEVRRINNSGEARKCHILFIDNTYYNAAQLIAATEESAILTVADFANFMERGGMIRFMLEKNKVKIEVNPDRARDHGLRISSKLLRLAKIYGQ